jgi:hypothetical protein
MTSTLDAIYFTGEKLWTGDGAPAKLSAMPFWDYTKEAAGMALWAVFTELWSLVGIVAALVDYGLALRSRQEGEVMEQRRAIKRGARTLLVSGVVLFAIYFVVKAPYEMVTRAREEVTAAQKEGKWLYSEQPADLGGSSWKFGLRVIIQANTQSAPFAVRLYTDKPVGMSECEPLPTKYGPFEASRRHGSVGDPDGKFVECHLLNGISPDAPVMLRLFATERFTVTKWVRIQE